jgi:cytochrome b
MQRILIWDWPTRLVHWLLAPLVFFSWGAAEFEHMDLHRYSGYTILGLLVFRLYWGIVGSHTARFKNFVKGPRAVLSYLREASGPTAYSLQPKASRIGHNPLGALSVIALLALLVTQVTLGLFAVDTDGLESGPLSGHVSFETGRAIAKLHGKVFDALLVLIALHVLAILFYLIVNRDNLIAPMLSGKKAIATDASVMPVIAPLMRAVIGVLIAAAIVWFIV